MNLYDNYLELKTNLENELKALLFVTQETKRIAIRINELKKEIKPLELTILKELEKITGTHNKVFTLLFLEGHSIADVAEELHLSSQYVRNIKSETIKKIQKKTKK